MAEPIPCRTAKNPQPSVSRPVTDARDMAAFPVVEQGDSAKLLLSLVHADGRRGLDPARHRQGAAGVQLRNAVLKSRARMYAHVEAHGMVDTSSRRVETAQAARKYLCDHFIEPAGFAQATGTELRFAFQTPVGLAVFRGQSTFVPCLPARTVFGHRRMVLRLSRAPQSLVRRCRGCSLPHWTMYRPREGGTAAGACSPSGRQAAEGSRAVRSGHLLLRVSQRRAASWITQSAARCRPSRSPPRNAQAGSRT